MTDKSARDIWDSRAESRLKFMQSREMSRTAALYEQGCMRFIENLLPSEKGRILEAGCGTGSWIYRFAHLGHSFVLADFSPEMIRVAGEELERRGMRKMVEGLYVLDICDMNKLENDSFDMALAMGEPVGLCGDPQKALIEMRRLVKPGGYVICDLSNRYRRALDAALENEFAMAAGFLDSGNTRSKSGFSHRSFSPDEARELFKECGLKEVHLAALCPFLSFPPGRDQASRLESDESFNLAAEVFQKYAEDPAMIAISSRMLWIGRKP